MKNIYFYLSLILLLSFSGFGKAQSPNGKYNVTVTNTQVNRVDGQVNISMDVVLNNIDLGSQEMISVTPVIVSQDNMYTYEFNPFIITGSVRDKALNRSVDFGHIKFEKEPQFIVRNKNNRTVPLNLSLPYQEWLHNARLEFHNDLTGCACENLYNGNNTVLMPILPSPPQLQIAYITPPVEEVKQRSETYSARLNFELNRYQILRDFKNNATVLREVDNIVNEIRNDDNLTITEFMITGYASPEGNPQSNMTLSKNRAESFVKYLSETYNISPSTIRTDWKGEDWDGLRKVVSEIDIQDKQQILDILDNESDVMNRKRRLQQLSGGIPYRKLLQEYYPALRRNDYTISYVSRNFDVTEAREIIKTKPQHLSQNEMYMVANSYPRDSREFREVFEIISRYYPNDNISRLNNAAYELENGSVETAIIRLNEINTPEAWNNLGVAYYRKNDLQQAQTYFNRAAQSGLQTAISNLSELNKQ